MKQIAPWKCTDKFWMCILVILITFGVATPSIAEHEALRQVGTVRVLTPMEIAESPFSLGCETLDRELWDPVEIYPHLRTLGVKWARLQSGWARCEKEAGSFTWVWLDEAVDGMLEMGITPWLNVGYGNPIYMEGGARYHPMVSEEAYAAWKRYVVALTTHFKDRIQYYEIWNEPNLPGFWRPSEPDPAAYARLVRDTAKLIRENDPGAIIIGGVTAGIPIDYIKRSLEAGLADHIDIFSFHPYSTYPESYSEKIRALRRLLDSHHPGIGLWQGENGFPSAPDSTGFKGEGPWTESIQAKLMLRRLLLDCELEMSLSNWFIVVDLHDYPVGTGNTNWKGILRARPEISPKPAFNALQNLTSLVHGKVRPRITTQLFSADTLSEEDKNATTARNRQSIPNIHSVCLNTANGPVLAYWNSDKAEDQKEPGLVNLLFSDWEGEGFTEPVLADPLTGKLYDIPSGRDYSGSDTGHNRAMAIWTGLPVTDYPLLVIEKQHVATRYQGM